MGKEAPFTMSLNFWRKKNPKNKELLEEYTERFRLALHQGSVLEVHLYDEFDKIFILYLRRSIKY